MSEAAPNPTPHSQIPQITALSTAFPLDFESGISESPKPKTQSDQNPPSRVPHRHDAGE